MKNSTKTTAKTPRRDISAGIMLIASILFLSGCTATTVHRHHEYDPGTSVTIEYQYYPDENVYYDVHRHLYLYHHARRGWISVENLPAHIHINRQRHHVIHSRQRQPWNDNHAYKQQHTHNDGQRSNERDETRDKHDKSSPKYTDSRHELRSGREERDNRQQQAQKHNTRQDVPREHGQTIQNNSRTFRNEIRGDDNKRANGKERKLRKVSQHEPEQKGQRRPVRYDYHGMKRYD